MKTKIRVYGKAQSRTVLGIVNAYLTMNPKATLADLERQFPASLNSGLKAYKLTSSFVTPEILKSRDNSKIRCCFEDNPIKLSNGSTIYLFSLWQKEDFDKVVELARGLSIEVVDYKPTNGFEIGGYRLEYLNGYVPVVAKSGSKLWLVILLFIGILGLLLFFLLGKEEESVAPAPEPTPIVEVAVVEQIKEIQTKFNAIQFDLNKHDLSSSANSVLSEIVDLMVENPDIKLNVVGHSSDDGEPTANLILSEKRAKEVANYIISKGIDADRITSEGKGSSEPLNTNNRAENRRTEFVIIKGEL